MTKITDVQNKLSGIRVDMLTVAINRFDPIDLLSLSIGQRASTGSAGRFQI
ncbi:MAG TPA: hypothetical protein VIF10_12745 [Methylobacter sp.]